MISQLTLIKAGILTALVIGTLTIGLWPSTLILAAVWVMLRLHRAWFWFGPGSRERIQRVAEADPGFGERLLWWR